MNSASLRPGPRRPKEWECLVLWLVALILVIGLLGLVSGCSPRIVERVVVQHDTTRVVVRDSVRFYDRDSIYIREKGDTVYQYVEKWRWRDRVRIDTFYKVRIDSVAVERIKEVEVARPLSWWEKARIGSFWYLCGAILLLLLWTFRKFIFKI